MRNRRALTRKIRWDGYPPVLHNQHVRDTKGMLLLGRAILAAHRDIERGRLEVWWLDTRINRD